MPIMGGGYLRWNGPQFNHRSITPLVGGLLVLSALDGNSYFFPPEDPLYPDYYNLWNNGYNGGFGNQYGGGFAGPYGNGFGNLYGGYGGNYGSRIWNPWKASPRFTRWPSYQSNSGLGFLAGLTLGGLFGGRGGRRIR